MRKNTPVSYDNPFPVEVEKDKAYFWCSCGKSKNQPFCDGSHAGWDFSSKKFIASESFTISIAGMEADISITGIDKSIENFAASTLFKPTILEPV